MSKIESFRALLRQESAQNELRIFANQENFKNLINPEVTRKEYTILDKSPSRSEFYMGNIQNQQILTKKENHLLHTITDEFLQDSYPVTRDENTGTSSGKPVKAHQRFALEPNEFRLKLARKI